MARDGVAVQAQLVAAVVAHRGGELVNVAAVCRELGISRKTFYKYRRRFVAEGVEGFFPRSRRPGVSPGAVSAQMADVVVRARKELAEQGWDCGATSIRWRLVDCGVPDVPSRATIHRVLVRHGQVVPAPAKGPRPKWRRFRAPAVNQMWQLDGFELRLADGSTAVVLQILDDYSRLDLCCHAAVSENGQDAWQAFRTAVTRYGLPRVLLTDNGTAFNNHRRGSVSDLERRVNALGVTPISSSVHHPQTCGKNERAHATTRQWLRQHPPATDLPHLQQLLERYRHGYNNRRHQGLDGLTPQQAWDTSPKTTPDGTPPTPPTRVIHRDVSPRGSIALDNVEIGLGRRHHGRPATIFRTGDNLTIFVDDEHVRNLTIDHTRRYQPQQRPTREVSPKS